MEPSVALAREKLYLRNDFKDFSVVKLDNATKEGYPGESRFSTSTFLQGCSKSLQTKGSYVSYSEKGTVSRKSFNRVVVVVLSSKMMKLLFRKLMSDGASWTYRDI